MPAVVHAQGGNYEIQIFDGVVTCRVWKRPDVSAQQGGVWAEEIRSHMVGLAQGPRRGAHAAVLDLSQAPSVAGPVTVKVLGGILSAWEVAGRRLAVIVGDHPLQGLQLRRLAKENAPSWGRVCDAAEQGREWVETA